MPKDTGTDKIYAAFFEPEFPPDLILFGLWLAAGILSIYIPILNASAIKNVLAIPVLLFIPGYCVFAALFPKIDDIGFTERIALSFGLSIALAALIGFALQFTQGESQLDLLVLISILVADVMILIAFFRRAFIPVDQRFRMPFSKMRDTIRSGLFPAEGDKLHLILGFILVLLIIVAIATTIYIIAFPTENEHFSEFFILGENKMATDYPDLIIIGQDYPMFIGVGNHEYRNMTYTIETWNLLTEFNTVTNTTTVLAMDPNDQMSLTLTHNETKTIPYSLSLNKTGYNRVDFLLFNETVPGPDVTGSDRINASYRDLYLNVNVNEIESQVEAQEPSD